MSVSIEYIYYLGVWYIIGITIYDLHKKIDVIYYIYVLLLYGVVRAVVKHLSRMAL